MENYATSSTRQSVGTIKYFEEVEANKYFVESHISPLRNVSNNRTRNYWT